jgi:hypothetical protein
VYEWTSQALERQWLRLYRFRAWSRDTARLCFDLVFRLPRWPLLLAIGVALIDFVVLDEVLPVGTQNTTVDQLQAFPSASGILPEVLLGGVFGIVALIFSVSLVAQDLSRQRYGEQASSLLFREPTTRLIREALIASALLVLAVFVESQFGIFVPYLGTYLAIMLTALSVLVLPVYLGQSLSSSRLEGLCNALTQEINRDIMAVLNNRSRNRSIDAHMRFRTTTNIRSLEQLAERLQVQLHEETDTGKLSAFLTNSLTYYLHHKHLIPETSEWFPAESKELDVNDPLYQNLRSIYASQALGPARKEIKNLSWFEDDVLRVLETIRKRAVASGQERLHAGIAASTYSIIWESIRSLELDTTVRLSKVLSQTASNQNLSETVASTLESVIRSLLHSLVQGGYVAQRASATMPMFRVDADELARLSEPAALQAATKKLRAKLDTEKSMLGSIVTPSEWIEDEARSGFENLLKERVALIVPSLVEGLYLLSTVPNQAGITVQRNSSLDLIVQLRGLFLHESESCREYWPYVTKVLTELALAEPRDRDFNRNTLDELIHACSAFVGANEEELLKIVLPCFDAFVWIHMRDDDESERRRGVRAMLALGGLLYLDSEFRQDKTRLDSYSDFMTKIFRGEYFKAISEDSGYLFSASLGGSLIMEYENLLIPLASKVQSLRRKYESDDSSHFFHGEWVVDHDSEFLRRHSNERYVTFNIHDCVVGFAAHIAARTDLGDDNEVSDDSTAEDVNSDDDDA